MKKAIVVFIWLALTLLSFAYLVKHSSHHSLDYLVNEMESYQ